MMRTLTIFITAFIIYIGGETLYGHCQIPCGIYDDHARVEMMLEDTATIDRSIEEMGKLREKRDLTSQNQMVRWIMNKEEHAENIITTISDYFLTQRVKEGQEDYEKRLVDHHRVMVSAMKVKQDPGKRYVDELRSSIEALKIYYPEHKH